MKHKLEEIVHCFVTKIIQCIQQIGLQIIEHSLLRMPKNRCKLNYLQGPPIGTAKEKEDSPGRYAWVEMDPDGDRCYNCKSNSKINNCTYSGDNKTKDTPRSFSDYVKQPRFDGYPCQEFDKKVEECQTAWRNYNNFLNEKNKTNTPYDGSFCMQTLPDEKNETLIRGDCPLFRDKDNTMYPANWITNNRTFSIEDAKNRCKLNYLQGPSIGTVEEKEDSPGRYAWVEMDPDGDRCYSC